MRQAGLLAPRSRGSSLELFRLRETAGCIGTSKAATPKNLVARDRLQKTDSGPKQTMKCSVCEDCGWVCESHPYLPWQGEHACNCGGAGEACPRCNPGDRDIAYQETKY